MPSRLRLALPACLAALVAAATPTAGQAAPLVCAPEGFAAQPLGVVIHLTWNLTPGASAYHIYRAQADGESPLALTATVPGSEAESFDTHVEGGVTYRYAARAVVGGLELEPCGVVEARADDVPCRPGLTALALDGPAVRLQWTAVAIADGYTIYRAEGDGPLAALVSVDASTQALLDEDVEAGVAYSYAVATVIDGRERAPCGTIEVTAIPSFPTAVGVVAAAVLGAVGYGLARRRP